MLVVPLVSKSTSCVIKLSQQGEVCSSGISSHLVKAIHSKASFISGPFRTTNQFSLIYQLTEVQPPPIISKPFRLDLIWGNMISSAEKTEIRDFTKQMH